MKNIKRNLGKLVVCGTLILACLSEQAFAIEGLTISVPDTYIVLAWPSDPSETYLIQYRHTLDATDSWMTLADYYPPDYTTNVTRFYDTNIDFGSFAAGNGTLISKSGTVTPMSASRLATAGPLTMDDIMAILMPPGLATPATVATTPATLNTAAAAGALPKAGSPQPRDHDLTSTATPGTGFYRVVRDGIHLVGVTNGMVLNGTVKIPIELGNDGGEVVSLCMNSDDSPVAASIQVAPSLDPSAITLDTTTLPNGLHDIYASARWEDTNGNAWEADSPTFSVTTSNEITFENWMPYFGETGNSLLICATSAHANTDWQIDVYDSHYAYVGSFVGHTYDGGIYVVWNLQDYFGNYHTNDDFFIAKVSTQYIDPVTPKTFKKKDPWSGPGAWVAVTMHAWDNAVGSDLLYKELGGFIRVAQNANWPVYPQPGDDGQGYPIPYALKTGADGDANWQAFRAALYNPKSRNLVYCGHGAPRGIGENFANTNQYISSAEVGRMLRTIPVGQPNPHTFRFVFMDGCSTAKGNFPEAFGIIHRENVDLTNYIASSLRPSAFAGWQANKWIDIGGFVINYHHVSFITFVQDEMILYGNGIHTAIQNASRYPGVTWSFNWINQMAVFGFWDLHVGQYNN